MLSIAEGKEGGQLSLIRHTVSVNVICHTYMYYYLQEKSHISRRWGVEAAGGILHEMHSADPRQTVTNVDSLSRAGLSSC